jgi:hypothetical protein
MLNNLTRLEIREFISGKKIKEYRAGRRSKRISRPFIERDQLKLNLKKHSTGTAESRF